MSIISAVVGFLDQGYRYKSVATQIPHDAELAPVRSAVTLPVRNFYEPTYP